MSKVVIILGAGASFHTGAPLMNNFMRRIRNISELPNIPCIKEDYNLVMKGFFELSNQRHKIKMEYEDNIELLFGSFEMAKLIKTLGNMSTNEIDKLTESMRRVICHTIDQSINVSISGNETISSFDQYQMLAQLLQRIITEKNIIPTIITFNYDICLELILASQGIPFNYGFEPKTTNSINYYKLHGSINWKQLPNQNTIEIIPIKEIIEKFTKGFEVPKPINILENYFIQDNSWQCSPFIVPPTWNKTNYHHTIENIWKKALSELSDVQHFFIIGYSLPPTDLFFRHLLSLGMTSTILDTFMVIDILPDPVQRMRDIAGDTLLKIIQPASGGGLSQRTISQMQAVLLEN